MNNTEELGAQAFIDHVMPIVREASRSGIPNEILMAYGGCIGALWGSMVADFGTEMATQILKKIVRKIMAMDRLDELVQ